MYAVITTIGYVVKKLSALNELLGKILGNTINRFWNYVFFGTKYPRDFHIWLKYQLEEMNIH